MEFLKKYHSKHIMVLQKGRVGVPQTIVMISRSETPTAEDLATLDAASINYYKIGWQYLDIKNVRAVEVDGRVQLKYG